MTVIIVGAGLCLTYKTGVFDRTPEVLASGIFIISTKVKTNEMRDREINKSRLNTLQLINVGRGIAKNITPSIIGKAGQFLEDICPHSFNLPAGKSTREMGEVLRVHGQNFLKKKKGEFNICFENHKGKKYITKVLINKVEAADGEIGSLIKTEGIEIWKVVVNKKS